MNSESSWSTPVVQPTRYDLETIGVLLEMNAREGEGEGADKGRDNKAIRRAAFMRKIGWPKDEVLAKLKLWNEKHCIPPLPERTIESKVDSAWNMSNPDFGYTSWPELKEARLLAKRQLSDLDSNNPSPLPDEDYSDLHPSIKSHFFHDQPVKIAEDRLETWEEICQNPALLKAPERLTLLTGFRGRTVLCWGVDKSGKGTLGCTEINDSMNRRLRSLWIGADEPKGDFASRMSKSGLAPTTLLGTLFFPNSWHEIIFAIQRHRPDIVYIDALTTVCASLGTVPDSNDDSGWEAIMTKFRILAEVFNIAVVIFHHSTKSVDNRQYRNNAMIGAGVSMRIKVNTNKQNLTTTLTYEGRFPVPEVVLKYKGDYHYEIVSDKMEVAPATECTIELTANDKKIIGALLDGKEHSRSELAKRFRLEKSVMTKIKQRCEIKSRVRGSVEVWHLHHSQITSFKPLFAADPGTHLKGKS